MAGEALNLRFIGAAVGFAFVGLAAAFFGSPGFLRCSFRLHPSLRRGNGPAMANGFERFETKPKIFTCRRVWIDTAVDTPLGRRMAFAGMWIIVAKSGDAAIYPDDIFRDEFTPTNSASEAMWRENPGKGLHPQIPYAWDEEPEAEAS